MNFERTENEDTKRRVNDDMVDYVIDDSQDLLSSSNISLNLCNVGGHHSRWCPQHHLKPSYHGKRTG